MSEQIKQQILPDDSIEPLRVSSKLDYEFNSEILKALEWSAEFPDLNWSQIQEKLIEENSTNKDKPWKIPTVEELIYAQENNVEGFNRNGGATYWCADLPKYKGKEEFNKKTNEIYGREESISRYYINMFNGGLFPGNKTGQHFLRLVR